MSNSLNMTQFGLTDQAGRVMNINPDTISVRVVSTSNPVSGYLQAGDFVMYHPTEAGNSPVVQQGVSGGKADGVVIFNQKKNQYNALDMLEMAFAGSIITVIAGAAFSRKALLNYVPGTAAGVTGYVYSTTSAIAVAEALDIASAIGDVVRVRIL